MSTERMSRPRRARAVFLGAIVLVLVAAFALGVWRTAATNGGPRWSTLSSEPNDPSTISANSADPASDAPSPSASGLYVHVVGAVSSPGLYRVPAGSRLADAVAAAGGPLPDADVSSVNLARALIDGEQIVIPVTGSGQASPAAGADGIDELVSLNSATAGELETLPGVGPALAARIIAYRQESGGFRTIDDLLGVSGIGERTLESLRPLVTL